MQNTVQSVGYVLPLIAIEVIFSAMVLIALRNAGAKRTTLSVIGAVFAVWLPGAFQLLSNGFFTSTGVPQAAFTIAVMIPIIAGFLGVRLWTPLRDAVEAMPTQSFLRLQMMRMPFGLIFFLVPELPVWFRYVGGLGDIAAGVGASVALYLFRSRPDQERSAILRGNLVGILDFAVVIYLGFFVVLSHRSPDFLFDLIPLYGVPLFALLHTFSLRRLGQIGEVARA